MKNYNDETIKAVHDADERKTVKADSIEEIFNDRNLYNISMEEIYKNVNLTCKHGRSVCCNECFEEAQGSDNEVLEDIRMIGTYILDEDSNPISCEDMGKWGKWMEENDRHVALDYVTDRDGNEVKISTVFLGVNHGFGLLDPDDCRPVLYETMIFGGRNDGYQTRYATKEEAMKGHQEAIKIVKADGNK